MCHRVFKGQKEMLGEGMRIERWKGEGRREESTRMKERWKGEQRERDKEGRVEEGYTLLCLQVSC